MELRPAKKSYEKIGPTNNFFTTFPILKELQFKVYQIFLEQYRSIFLFDFKFSTKTSIQNDILSIINYIGVKKFRKFFLTIESNIVSWRWSFRGINYAINPNLKGLSWTG